MNSSTTTFTGRRVNVHSEANASNSTSATIYSVPATGRFYLTGCQLSVCKDVTSTSTISSIKGQITDNVGADHILAIAGITLTAQADSVSISFNEPLLMKASSNITINNGSAVANIISSGAIYGIYEA